MVSALDSGSRGLGSSPGWVIMLCSLGKTLYSHCASLHPGVNGYQQTVRGNLTKCWEVTCDGLNVASHPGGNKPSHFMLQKPG